MHLNTEPKTDANDRRYNWMDWLHHANQWVLAKQQGIVISSIDYLSTSQRYWKYFADSQYHLLWSIPF